MISEPELDGEWESARPAEVAEQAPPPERGPGRPWRWVAATAVATSVLWGVGLYAFGDRLARPEMRYRVPDNLCEQFAAEALSPLLSDLSSSTEMHHESRHPAIDWASCGRSDSNPMGSDNYMLQAEVELHKRTDPAAEFEAGGQYDRMFGTPDGGMSWEPVSGLGERALINARGDGSDVHLKVRDGGTVFSLRLIWIGGPARDADAPQEGGEGDGGESRARPGRKALDAAMTKDVRALMAALRT
ncbi:hypothetical protein ACFWSF_12185 [Streptomyces sp. NPDC058611]|uniref:hypothetical protein n=1 Tax=unclassified Streptomyces TaxID=2593676 RepID=UPI003649DFF5